MRHPLTVVAVALYVSACSGAAGPLQAPAPQGLVLPVRIEFPPTMRDANAWAEGLVRNDGATPLELRIETGLPFGPPLRRFVLGPGEERAIRFTFQGNSYADAGFAEIHAGDENRRILLTGTTLYGCGDPCHVRTTPDDPCVPAPDGTACGSVHECNDGSICRAGACVAAPPRDGAACQTECGADGTCADELCFSPAPDEEPVWVWESPSHVHVRHVDDAGTLIESGDELIFLDARGEEAWRIANPLRRRFHPPAQDGVLFFTDDEGFGDLDLRTGAERWRSDRLLRWDSLAWLSPTMAVLRSSGEDEEGTPTTILRAVDRRDGEELWSRELLRRAASALGRPTGWYGIAVNGSGDRLWVSASVTYTVGPEGRFVREWVLFGLDPANGSEQWTRRGEGGVQHIFVAGDDAFLAVWHHYRKREVHSLDEDGDIRWSAETGASDHQGQNADAPELLIGDTLFLTTGAALDRATGSPRPGAPLAFWSVAEPVGSTMFGVDQAPRALFPRAIVGFDPASGELRFELPLQTTRIRSLAGGEELLVEAWRSRDRAQVDSLLCRFDAGGRLLQERRLPLQPGERTASVPHPPGLLHFRSFEDRLEAWPLER